MKTVVVQDLRKGAHPRAADPDKMDSFNPIQNVLMFHYQALLYLSTALRCFL
jgi:hypothetical protein